MSLDPKHITLLVLGARDQELAEVSATLTQDLTGDPANDNVIRQKLQDITSERFAIAARRAAIIGGGQFTPPSDAAVNALQQAIINLHQAVMGSAASTQLIQLATALLNQYGAHASKAA